MMNGQTDGWLFIKFIHVRHVSDSPDSEDEVQLTDTQQTHGVSSVQAELKSPQTDENLDASGLWSLVCYRLSSFTSS